MAKSFQDYYPDFYKHCFGCGPLNRYGLKLRSFWDGDEAVAMFTPEPYHMAFPGYVYGGLIASVIDCHCIGTAAAAAYRNENRQPGSQPAFRYVTASLSIDYLKPTPLGPGLEIRAVVDEIKGKKTIVQAKVIVDGTVSARGRVVAVLMPEHLAETG